MTGPVLAGADDVDRPPRRTDTEAPRRARERAVKILFQADVRHERPVAALDRVADDPRALAMLDESESEADAGSGGDDARGAVRRPRAAPLDAFTRSLVVGVDDHLDDLDALIDRFAQNWTVRRMPAVDRTLLRLATFELVHGDLPAAVVIDEALELAKRLSTDRSPRFINGVLGAIRRDLDGDGDATADA